MKQHFLTSAKAQDLGLPTVFKLTDEQQERLFALIRWEATDGKPVCPYCECTTCYTARRKSGTLRFRCRDCRRDFSLTSGTLFEHRKKPLSTYLAAVVMLVNEKKGMSSLALSRHLRVQQKTAWVLAHKIGDAMAREPLPKLIGGPGKIVEIDGAYFGGHVRPHNLKARRKDRRKAAHQTGKRHSVVVIRVREPGGLVWAQNFASEKHGTDLIREVVHPETELMVDDALCWNSLSDTFVVHKINHSVRYSDGMKSTNLAESFFSRLRRAEKGVYHRISGLYLGHYAKEAAFRERHFHDKEDDTVRQLTGIALVTSPSRRFGKYWQRSEYYELTKPLRENGLPAPSRPPCRDKWKALRRRRALRLAEEKNESTSPSGAALLQA